MQQLNHSVHRRRGELLLILQVSTRTRQRSAAKRVVNVRPHKRCGLVRKLVIDTEHAGIFVAVLRAFANPLRDAGIDQCLPFWIRVENRLKSRGLRRNLGAEGVAWRNCAEL